MRHIAILALLFPVAVVGTSALPFLGNSETPFKRLLDMTLGVDKWSVVLPDGMEVDETANVATLMRKIIIRSDNVPSSSDVSNSTIVMDFKKGVVAALLRGTKLGDMCVFTETSVSFSDAVAEISRRKDSKVGPQTGTVTFYALNSHRIRTVPALLKMGGFAVSTMCSKFVQQGRVYHVIKEGKRQMNSTTVSASGFISPSEPGTSVTVNIVVEDNESDGNGSMTDVDSMSTMNDDTHMSMMTDDAQMMTGANATDVPANDTAPEVEGQVSAANVRMTNTPVTSPMSALSGPQASGKAESTGAGSDSDVKDSNLVSTSGSQVQSNDATGNPGSSVNSQSP